MSWKDIVLENDHIDTDLEPDCIFEGIEPAIAFTYRKAADYMNRHRNNHIVINECDVSFVLENQPFDGIINSTRHFSISMAVPECNWDKILRIDFSAAYDISAYKEFPIKRDNIYIHDSHFASCHNSSSCLKDMLIRDNFKGFELESGMMRFSNLHDLEDYLIRMENDPDHDFKYHFVKSSLQFLPEYLVESLRRSC